MATTHIEVLNAKNNPAFMAGQLLKVVRETPAFYWVAAHNGTSYQVSKKTKRINGTASSFIKTANQPEMNF